MLFKIKVIFFPKNTVKILTKIQLLATQLDISKCTYTEVQ